MCASCGENERERELECVRHRCARTVCVDIIVDGLALQQSNDVLPPLWLLISIIGLVYCSLFVLYWRSDVYAFHMHTPSSAQVYEDYIHCIIIIVYISIDTYYTARFANCNVSLIYTLHTYTFTKPLSILHHHQHRFMMLILFLFFTPAATSDGTRPSTVLIFVLRLLLLLLHYLTPTAPPPYPVRQPYHLLPRLHYSSSSPSSLSAQLPAPHATPAPF